MRYFPLTTTIAFGHAVRRSSAVVASASDFVHCCSRALRRGEVNPLPADCFAISLNFTSLALLLVLWRPTATMQTVSDAWG